MVSPDASAATKILVVNPNSSHAMTRGMEEVIRAMTLATVSIVVFGSRNVCSAAAMYMGQVLMLRVGSA